MGKPAGRSLQQGFIVGYDTFLNPCMGERIAGIDTDEVSVVKRRFRPDSLGALLYATSRREGIDARRVCVTCW